MTGGHPVRGLSPDAQKALVAILMAMLTVLATGVATLQQSASGQAAAAERSADLRHHEADAAANRTQAQNARELMVYRYWYEQRLRATTAADRAAAEGDPQLAAGLWARSELETRIEDWLEANGELFAAPWYDPQTDTNDFAGFYGRSSAAITRLGEQAARDDAVADAWQAIAGESVTVLTVVALALFFLGLSASLGGRRRGVLAGVGVAAAVAAVAWTGSLAIRPVHAVPDAAIDAYVRSSVAIAGLPEGLNPTVESRLGEAAAAAAEAVALDPAYRSARAQVALVATVRADRHTYQPGGDPAEAAAARAMAVTAYETLLADHPDDAEAWWNLGYLRYFTGDAASAVEATTRALALRPGMFPLELNLAYARLAAGDSAGAGGAIDAAITHAAAAPRGEALWYLDEGDRDLGRLLEIRPDPERPTLTAIRARLREVAVSLRVRGTATPAAGMPRLEVVEGAALAIDRATGEREAAPLAAGGTATGVVHGVRLHLGPGGDVPAGAVLSARVWVDGVEDLALRTDLPWPSGEERVDLELLGPYGAAGFAAAAGRYAVELYLDGALAGSTNFTVAP